MSFCQAIQPGKLPLPSKVAWSPNLGIAPVDAEVVTICKQAAGWFASVGAQVVHDCPDLHDATHIFQVSVFACACLCVHAVFVHIIISHTFTFIALRCMSSSSDLGPSLMT